MPSKKSKKKLSRWLLMVFVLLCIGALYIVYLLFGPNTGSFSKGEYLFIHTGSNYEQVKQELKDGGLIANIHSFDKLAQRMGYPEKVKAGKYHIRKGMGNLEIIRMLRNGAQEPVKLVINKLRTIEDLKKLWYKNFEADTSELILLLNDTGFLKNYNLQPATAIAAFMPNTYEFYWNTSTEKVFKKIAASYTSFWTDERKAKANKLGLTPAQTVTLASIVEEETNKQDEKGKVASVYLNRMNKGMRLQADPTARFAGGDFTIKRVTSKQTSIASPYNTYYVSGLPIGPICTPSAKTIDAILQSEKTNYLYFCAKEDFSGYHNFAASYDEHLKNASKYQKALNARNIK